MLDLDKLREYLNSEECVANDKIYFAKLKIKDFYEKRHIKKIKKYILSKTDEELEVLFDKFIIHAEKRKEIYYKKYIDNGTSLYPLLVKVLGKIGKKTKNKHCGYFTSAMYDYKGFRIELYSGQGCGYVLSKI